ncbi:MAG: shikimate kinase [Lachnospiraceae bacterium]|nr:shikimate kinase [Lachnospiraceae bacterium]
MQLKRHLYLIGFMGVGKTSTSKQLSKKLGLKEVDTDKMIVEKEGKAISDIFADSGEEYFRGVETGILDLLAEEAPCIVSCGGGMAMREENVRKMKRTGLIVFLVAEPETIYEHVKDSTDRPLLHGNMNVPYIAELMAKREPKYQEAADIIIKTDGYAPFQIADQIIEMVEKI